MIFWATVFYPTRFFEKFFFESLGSIKNQTYQEFTLLIFLDNIEKDIELRIKNFFFDTKIKILFFYQPKIPLDTCQIRQFLINKSIESGADLLVFSDFDEIVDSNRLENIMQQIQDFDFSYHSCYITDFNLKKLLPVDIQSLKNIPDQIDDFKILLDKNFVGLGALSLNLKKNFKIFQAPKDIKAYDWFLATKFLLENKRGILIKNSFTHYRQHPESYVGINRPLDNYSLQLGLQVKIAHYRYFRKFHPLYEAKLQEIEELELFLKSVENKQKYITIINTHFDPTFLCWWENIKPLKEISQWI